MQLNKYNSEFKKYGTTMISPKDSFISPKDFKIIEKNLHLIKRENVKIGDAGEKNSVHVARLMTDVKKPKVVNHLSLIQSPSPRDATLSRMACCA